MRILIIEATTAEAGLALFKCAGPDIALLDVEMPGIDGLEALRTLHATHESTPVVMMSADRSRGPKRCARVRPLFLRSHLKAPRISQGRSRERCARRDGLVWTIPEYLRGSAVLHHMVGETA